MKQALYSKLIIGALISSNALTLFFLFRLECDSRPRGPRKSLVELLDLEGVAKNKIAALEKIHFRQKELLNDESRRLHEQLFKTFNSDNTTGKSTFIIHQIVENKRQNELQTFEYFKKVHTLCNAEQQAELNTILHHALRRLSGTPPHHHPHHHPRH